MNDSSNQPSDLDQAIAILRENGLCAKKAYGFSIRHEKMQEGQEFMQCGLDNDFSISLWVHSNEDPPIVWFFRFSFIEMADFIVAAYSRAGIAAGIDQIMRSLREEDDKYDHADLQRRLKEEFRFGFEDT
jgi:hypothetical protein